MKAIGLQNLVSLYKQWIDEQNKEAEAPSDDNDVTD